MSHGISWERVLGIVRQMMADAVYNQTNSPIWKGIWGASVSELGRQHLVTHQVRYFSPQRGRRVCHVTYHASIRVVMIWSISSSHQPVLKGSGNLEMWTVWCMWRKLLKVDCIQGRKNSKDRGFFMSLITSQRRFAGVNMLTRIPSPVFSPTTVDSFQWSDTVRPLGKCSYVLDSVSYVQRPGIQRKKTTPVLSL